jgi:PQQ-dependent dehydrogenase (methanol/ethanol family)
MDQRIKLLVFATIAAGAGVLLAQQNVADTVRNPLAADPAAVTEGQRLYNQTCQACHGPASQGDRGPALNTPTLAHGSDDGELFHTIRTGLPGTQMPPFARLTDTETWQLVSYVHSLQGITSAAGALSASTITVAGDAAAGEAVFFGKAACSSCHEVNGRGGITGPDLSNAARFSPAALRQKIIDPNSPMAQAGGGAGRGAGGRGGGFGGRGGAPPTTLVVKMRDGHELRGVRRNEDTFSLQMVDASGQLHLLDKLKVASVTVENKSLMPGDYAARLSSPEITNLIAYLHAQQGRDLTKTSAQPMAGGVTFDRLRNSKAEPQNWLMYWGDYQGTHFSPLNQIDPANVKNLQGAWAAPIPGTTTLETSPIVVDGVMYVTSSGDPLTVVALDARTGRQIWSYSRTQKVKNPYEINPYNRGVSVLGTRLYVGTLDAALLSLDARTGLPLWESQVADTMEGFSVTSPPLIVKDRVIVGIAGGEFATRGSIQAFDAASGRHLWTFFTIPGPGEFGNDTWKGDSWKTGGGATWLTGTYDSELNTIYWPVGNPAAQIDRSPRGDLDNLFSDSVVALDPDTGQRKWHYQFTPNDGHDWDSVQDMMLVDRVWRGQNRKLLMHADRNAHFYVLDRTDGTFLSGTPFAYQNWNKGFDEKGRPIPVPGSNSSAEGSFLVYPTLGGGTNFQSPSYSPLTGWLYLEYQEAGQQFISAPAEIERGRQYIGRAAGRGAPPARGPNDPLPNSGIKAIDPETGKTVWDFKTYQGSLTNGVVATAGGIVFGSTRDGNVVALDARTGKHLWHFQTGGNNAVSPISYAIDGRQYVALAAGNTVFSFALPE